MSRDNLLRAALRAEYEFQWASASRQVVCAGRKYAYASLEDPPSRDRLDEAWGEYRDGLHEVYRLWREWSPLLGRQMPPTRPDAFRLVKATLSMVRWEMRGGCTEEEADWFLGVLRLREQAVRRAIHELIA